jgi:hypothetical protein
MSEKAKKYKELTKALEPGEASIQEIPRGPIAKFIGDDVSKAVRTVRDKMSGKIPLIDMTAGELLLGETPEALNDWSYGFGPVRVGRTDVQGPAGALYGLNVDTRILDVAGAAEIPYLLGKAGIRGAVKAAEKMAKPSPATPASEVEALAKKYGGPVKMAGGGRTGAFFSAIDKAIDVLKQKKGTGEQILKELEKAPGVKKEELEIRKIPEKLKSKQSITQEEVRALAAESPAPGVKPIVLGGGADPAFLENPVFKRDLMQLERAGFKPVVEGRNLSFINPQGKKLNRMDAELELGTRINTADSVQQATENAGAVKSLNFLSQTFEEAYQKNKPRFEKYTTPGGENYREILLQLDKPVGKPRDSLGGAPREVSREEAGEYLGLHLDMIGEDSQILIYPNGAYIERLPDGEYYGMAYNEDKVSANLEDIEEFLASRIDSDMLAPGAPDFRSAHFDDPNVLVHARVTDRTGPNGEKILYIEEVQSDWHQQARKERDRMIESQLNSTNEKAAINKKVIEIMGGPDKIDPQNPENAMRLKQVLDQVKKERRAEIAKEVPKDAAYAKPMKMFEGMSADDLLWDQGDNMTSEQRGWLKDYIERWELDVDGTPAGQAAQDQLVKEYDEWLSKNTLKGVPDAPFKNTSHELALKQILDMAAKEGYDKVAIAPGAEQVKRYNMSQYVDTLKGEKDASGSISLYGLKNDRLVVNKPGVKPEELADYIGKERAERVLSDLEQSDQFMLKGRDLEMTTKEGAGKKKIYDEILPNYLGKYAKKEFGVEPSQVEISSGWPKTEGNQIIEEERILRMMDEIAGEESDELMARTMDVNRTMAEDALADVGILRADLDEEMFEDQIWNVMDEFADRAREQAARELAVERIKQTNPESLRAFSVDITPQMREKITSQGQPLFSVAPPAALGATQAIPQKEEPAAEPEVPVEEEPQAFERGGQATPDSELEEDPFVRTVMNAARHYQAGKEIESGQVGFSKGPVTVGMNAANIIDPGTRDKMQAQALFAAYRDKLGGVDVNASVNKPAQAPDGFYQGNIMASTPVGQGRAMAGVSGYKSPQKTDVSGYNVGYEQKVGPGYMSGMVFQPKDRRQDTRYDVQYTIPFSQGGSVGLQSGGRVGMARAAADKLMRVLHGGPSKVTPEAGRAMDVTTDAGYAVKRGADKMLGKEGPPMVSQFDIPEGRLLRFEEQYSPEDVALMKRYFNKLPQGQAMKGEDIWDAAQGRDVIMEGIAKAGGFAGYERPNTGAVGKGQWFRVTEPEELKRGKARGGLAQATKPL